MSGKLGSANLTSVTNTVIYTAPVDNVATVSVNVTNRNSTNTTIRLAILDGDISTLTDADYFEYETTICGESPLERSGIVLSDGQSIMAYSSFSGISVQVWGWEELNG